jgi:hypothetical protein
MPLSRLSEVLWRERHLLELLLFKLEEEQMILTGGRTRWLSHATREVDNVLDEIRATDLGRTIEADEAAASLGLPAGSSLGALADAAPEPWDELLRAHRDAFVSLTSEISSISAGNRQLLAMSHRATQETLASLQSSVLTYDGTGQSAAQVAVAQLVDRAM